MSRKMVERLFIFCCEACVVWSFESFGGHFVMGLFHAAIAARKGWRKERDVVKLVSGERELMIRRE